MQSDNAHCVLDEVQPPSLQSLLAGFRSRLELWHTTDSTSKSGILAEVATVSIKEQCGLQEHEKPWVDRYQYLKQCGYELRSRYRPGWIPSYSGGVVDSYSSEDAIALPASVEYETIDATRVSDGALVHLHRVGSGYNDIRIAAIFSTCPTIFDRRNPWVPVLDKFQDENAWEMLYIVTPFLRPLDGMPFERVDDVVDFIDQILKGLVFLKQHGLGHGNINSKCVVVDADRIFLERCHPVRLDRSQDLMRRSCHFPRVLFPRKVRYRITDWSRYCCFDSLTFDTIRGRHLWTWQLWPVAEITMKDDVAAFGEVLKTISQTHHNLGFLRPLVKFMTEQPAADRPDVARVVQEWQRIRRRIIYPYRLWRLWPYGERLWKHCFLGVADLVRLAVLLPASYFVEYWPVHEFVARLILLF